MLTVKYIDFFQWLCYTFLYSNNDLGAENMINRIETVRGIVDTILLNMTDAAEIRCAYVHLYGVAQACALLAMKRGEDAELAIIAGMLHDISSFATMDSTDHAHRSAEMSRGILTDLHLFSDTEINLICSAIYNHSDKSIMHASLDELLKDADVMQHSLYNPLFKTKESEQKRLDHLAEEFNVDEFLSRRISK